MYQTVLSKITYRATLAALSLQTLFSTKNVFAAEGDPVPTTGALTADELFGGAGASGADFAADAGLSSGNLTSSIASIIRTALGFLGIVTVVIILYGGFLLMTAGGSEERIKDGKKFIIRGIIGLVIVVAAFSIAQFVIGSITGALSAAE